VNHDCNAHTITGGIGGESPQLSGVSLKALQPCESCHCCGGAARSCVVEWKSCQLLVLRLQRAVTRALLLLLLLMPGPAESVLRLQLCRVLLLHCRLQVSVCSTAAMHYANTATVSGSSVIFSVHSLIDSSNAAASQHLVRYTVSNGAEVSVRFCLAHVGTRSLQSAIMPLADCLLACLRPA
jgi:hypothetical protein